MKITEYLCKWHGSKLKSGYVRSGGYVNKENVPFQQILPLKLRNYVSGKSDRSNAPKCTQEMSLLFSCLKNNDFKEFKCSAEVAAFKNCFETAAIQKKELIEKEREGVLVPGEKQLTHRQANKLLKKFPT